MTASQNPRDRRKKLIVLPRLQLRLIRECALWPVATLLAASGLVALAWNVVANEAHAQNAELRSLALLLGAFALLVGVATFVILYRALSLSNRIVGPMYRLQHTLEAVRAGDLSARVTLRDHDLLRETADELNSTLEVLEARLANTTSTPVRPGVDTQPDVEAAPSLVAQASSLATTLPETSVSRKSRPWNL